MNDDLKTSKNPTLISDQCSQTYTMIGDLKVPKSYTIIDNLKVPLIQIYTGSSNFFKCLKILQILSKFPKILSNFTVSIFSQISSNSHKALSNFLQNSHK